MKQNGAEGLAAEEFTGMANDLDRLARPQSGWDPYEVWRTRVKAASSAMQERNAGAQCRSANSTRYASG